LGLPATKEVNDELVIKELWMETLRERKRKRIKNIFLTSPLTFILIIINMVLVGWILHILHVIFTDALDHMSLYEWTEHLYILAKNTFEEFFASISIVF
jgi:predicted nucleic acid-binding Zn ribbon protein